MLLEGLTAAGCLDRERELHRIAEEGASEFVWTWETEGRAVVVGRSGKIDTEVNVDACSIDDIPMLRRDSGGGTVLIGRGCLNYSLILNFEQRSELRDIAASYRIILDALRRSIAVEGIGREGTDLTFKERKFAGCSQRRFRRTLLHHGTILYDFDIDAVSRYLREPMRQPAHRRGRKHADFLTNCPLPSAFAERLARQFPEAQTLP